MSKKIQVTFDDWQVARLKKEADFLGMTVSAYIRMAMIDQVNKDFWNRQKIEGTAGQDSAQRSELPGDSER